MKIPFLNGFPKSGCHALQKAVELIGVPGSFNHTAHNAYEGKDEPIIFIKRDPRNIVLSWMRFQIKALTPMGFIAHFRKFRYDSLGNEMAEFEGWLSDPKTLVIAYEDLIASDQAIRKIAEHCEASYPEGAWEQLPGHTRTWNVNHSDYTKIWTPEVQNIWASEGGPELLARWGY